MNLTNILRLFLSIYDLTYLRVFFFSWIADSIVWQLKNVSEGDILFWVSVYLSLKKEKAIPFYIVRNKVDMPIEPPPLHNGQPVLSTRVDR